MAAITKCKDVGSLFMQEFGTVRHKYLKTQSFENVFNMLQKSAVTFCWGSPNSKQRPTTDNDHGPMGLGAT